MFENFFWWKCENIAYNIKIDTRDIFKKKISILYVKKDFTFENMIIDSIAYA